MPEGVWRKGNPPTLLVGMQICEATTENSMQVPQKTKNRIIIWSSNQIQKGTRTSMFIAPLLQ